MSLTPEEKKKIYDEEKARIEAQEHIKKEKKGQRFWSVITVIFVAIVIFTIFDSNSNEKNDQTTAAKTVKKESKEIVLNANVSISMSQLKVVNNDKYDWTNVRIMLDLQGHLLGGWYELKVPRIKAKTTRIFNLNSFTKDNGERFNPYAKKVQDITIYCDTPKGKAVASF